MRDYYGNTILDFAYDANGQPYSMHYNSTPYFYILNLQGDVIRMVDGNGNTVASYEYDPYGRVISATGSMADINPLRYRGYYYDKETKLYHLWSRYYDPQTGRFISADSFASTGQGILGNNMFAYCNNNPINNCDPTGNALANNTRVLVNDGLRSEYGGNFGTTSGGIPSSLPFVTLFELIVECVSSTINTIFYHEDKEEAKAFADAKVVTEDPSDTVIYRYYASKNENLTPRVGKDYDGLSFSTKPPKPGVEAVATTIATVNATGILYAQITSGTHVVVVPVGTSVTTWMYAGQNSIWSQTLAAIVIEIQR